MHLENYPSHNLPTGFTDEPYFLSVDPNPPRHRIAALLRLLLNLKGRIVAARGARGGWAAPARLV